MSDAITLVVAGALMRSDGQILMHKRPLNKQHGGLWEFPGGKVETGEVPVIALVREISEELGVQIEATDCVPLAFAEEADGTREKPIVILLYKVADWAGEPEALEGGEIGWFAPNRIASLDKPPLDIELADGLLRILPQ